MKRWFIVVGLGALLMTGCLTPEQRSQVRAEATVAKVRIEQLTDQLTDLWAEYKAGTLSFADYQKAVAPVEAAIAVHQGIKDNAEDVLNSDSDWTDYLDYGIQILIGVLGGGGMATLASRKRRKVNLLTGKRKGD